MNKQKKDWIKQAWDWVVRNSTAITGLIGSLMLIGFSKLIIGSILIGAAIAFISISITGIVIFCLTKVRFLVELELDYYDEPIVKAAKIIYNAMIRFIPILIYIGLVIGFAVSIFISQWRIDVPLGAG